MHIKTGIFTHQQTLLDAIARQKIQADYLYPTLSAHLSPAQYTYQDMSCSPQDVSCPLKTCPVPLKTCPVRPSPRVVSISVLSVSSDWHRSGVAYHRPIARNYLQLGGPTRPTVAAARNDLTM